MMANIAGAISTTIFAVSILPMLVKALRTKDLGSYSFPQVLLSNVGNVVHSVYVFNLPAGPIWALHSFYLVSAALMLVWYLRYAWRPAGPGGTELAGGGRKHPRAEIGSSPDLVRRSPLDNPGGVSVWLGHVNIRPS